MKYSTDLSFRESFTVKKQTFDQLEGRLDILVKAAKSVELKALFRTMSQYLCEDESCNSIDADVDMNPLHEPYFLYYEELGYRPFVRRDCNAKTTIATALEIFSDILPCLRAKKYANGCERDYYETIATAMYHLFKENSESYDVDQNFDDERLFGGRGYYYTGRMVSLSDFFRAFREEYLKTDAKLEQRNARLKRSNRYSDDSTFDDRPVDSALSSLGLNRRDAHFVDSDN